MRLAHLRVSKEANVAEMERARGTILGDEVREMLGGQIIQGLVGHTEDIGSEWRNDMILGDNRIL